MVTPYLMQNCSLNETDIWKEIKRMEVHESNIIGQPGHRLVLKLNKIKNLPLLIVLKKTHNA